MTSGTAEPDERLEVVSRLDPGQISSVSTLLEDVTDADGVRPISEHATLHLRHGGDTGIHHLLVWVDESDDADLEGTDGGTPPRLAGYLHLDVTDAVEGSSAELAVHPALRGRGIGRLLVQRAQQLSPDGRLRLWAHGEQSGARALAEALGFTRMRTLWQMRRSLFGALPAPLLPSGVRIRAFVPGQDDAEWVALNNLAFAAHPDQGTWTHDDLQQRLDEPWFDPAGFFLAVREDPAAPRGERIVGFHWTKVHGGVSVHHHGDGPAHVHDDGHGHEPLGEIYVLGVHPDEHGHGLGKALSLVGLRHLRSAGLAQAMLYVEADNAPAIALYSALGFTRWDTDVMFRSTP